MPAPENGENGIINVLNKKNRYPQFKRIPNEPHDITRRRLSNWLRQEQVKYHKRGKRHPRYLSYNYLFHQNF